MTELNLTLAADRSIAAQLFRTWDPFFARFGRLTSVQRAVIPTILEGNNVLVCAPTASGKTEAACAPLVERRIERQRPWTIVYVSPTRALVNDLYERLSPPLARIGVQLARRTGDHRDRFEGVPQVLVTTPESLDSMICRGRSAPAGHMLAHVDGVVLDEIHLLDGSARGEQLRWLLERLRRLRTYSKQEGWTSSDELQVIALSATLPNPEAVRDKYLKHGSIARIAGGREIIVVAPECAVPSVEVALPAYIERSELDEKLLVFSNARKRVDSLALELRDKLAPHRYRVLGHHGSLSVHQREETEDAFRTERRVVVVATSTLEIGIDIGDIDLVVLDGPAPDVSSLLQRIGRGNRRTGKTRVMACAGSAAEVLIQSAMLEAARAGRLGAVEHSHHYAVARQQIASFIFQSPRIARQRDTITSLLQACTPEVSPALLLDYLTRGADVVEDAGGVRLGEGWKEASTRGDIHSNIEGSLGHSVIDQESGRSIANGVRYAGGRRLAIAGNLLDVKRWNERKLEVRHAHNRVGAIDALWSYVTRAWVQGAGQPSTVREYLGFSPEQWPAFDDRDRTVVFHFGGAARKSVLKLLAARARMTTSVVIDDWTMRIPAGTFAKPPWMCGVGAATVRIMIGSRVDELEHSLGRPRANRFLPAELRIAEIEGWLGLEAQLEQLARATWVKPEDPATEEALRTLLQEM